VLQLQRSPRGHASRWFFYLTEYLQILLPSRRCSNDILYYSIVRVWIARLHAIDWHVDPALLKDDR
jgi:hypothetical protein